MRATATVPMSINQPVPPVSTPFDAFPDFGAIANVWSAKDGPWSDPTTWNLGRVPQAGDRVRVGSNVQYDAVSNQLIKSLSIEPGGLLEWRQSPFTFMRVQTIMVKGGGELRVGTPANPIQCDPSSTHFLGAEVVFADAPIDVAVDPNGWGNGLICLGKMTACGMDKGPSFVRLAEEPRAGQNPTLLRLQTPVPGWRSGDVVAIPDSRSVDPAFFNEIRSFNIDVCLITEISADFLTLTVKRINGVNVLPGQGPDGSILTSVNLQDSLFWDHPGQRDCNNVLDSLPHVVNFTRSVQFRSERRTGNRAHCVFTYRAEVDVRNAAFHGMGRTDKMGSDGMDANGRFAVSFRHLYGPASNSNQHAYAFSGCSVIDNIIFTQNNPAPPSGSWRYQIDNPPQFLWGIVISDAHHGLISNNVLYGWNGAGMAIRDRIADYVSFLSSYNSIEDNFSFGVYGESSPRAQDGKYGAGYWFNSPNNRYRRNVAASCICTYAGIVAGAGFDFDHYPATRAFDRVPNFKGADLSVSGQYAMVDSQRLPILEFTGGEAYGLMAVGFTAFNLGSDGSNVFDVPENLIGGLKVWNCYEDAVFLYPSSHFTFSDLVVRLDGRGQANGMSSGDYPNGTLKVLRGDIQGAACGWFDSICTPGNCVIQDSFFACTAASVRVTTQATPGSGAYILPRRLDVVNTRHGSWRGAPVSNAITMNYDASRTRTNVIVLDQVFVTGHNGAVGDNFQVFYNEQAADFIVPQTKYDPNFPSVPLIIGSPAAGLTNAQNWEQYGIAVAGAVLPSNATTRPGIVGKVL